MKLRKRTYTGFLSDAVTQRETHNRAVVRRAAAESFVLLKNDGNVLPLQKNSKIALYGAGAIYTVKGGTGSGDVNERDCVNIYQGLCNAGFEITSKDWLDTYAEAYESERMEWRDRVIAKVNEYDGNFFRAYHESKLVPPDGSALDVEAAKQDGADVAVYVIRRIAGEGADRHDTEGDYFITSGEKAILTQVCEAYKHVVLIINTGGLMDISFVDEFDNISSIIQFVQAGQEGGNALGDVLSGVVTPSGKLVDTWTMTYSDYPNASYFSHKSGDVFKEEYKEDIYVGYRYFDTFDIPVRYSFGYGLSYTNFELSSGNITVGGMCTKDAKVNVSVSVSNAGSIYAGKEVVQIYVSCPQGKLAKEFRRLVGFGKTKLLQPGETQNMEISFALDHLSSFREEDASWILECGLYGIWMGNSLADAKLIGSIELDNTAIVRKCAHICERRENLELLTANAEEVAAKEAAWHKAAEGLAKVCLLSKDIITETVEYSSVSDVFPGKAGEIVESLSLDQMIALATGDPGKGQGSNLGSSGQTVPGAAAETATVAAMEPWNVASIVLADGPAGLRLNRSYQVDNDQIVKGSMLEAVEGGFFAPKAEKRGTTYYQFCTAIPVGTLLAQSWDVELLEEIGEMIGHEMEEFEVSLWLAPGMNIHRNPLCGRNFEYYSEDPLVAGIMASAMTLGVQKVPGCGTTIKHFACNNQEDNRTGSDSIITERALREIYLKGFEIAVKNAQPMSIMTSYNMINGVHTANSYDLCTMAARDEWGFAGVIMTDWTTTTRSAAGVCTASGCMRAGNDMVMPGDPIDHDNIRKELANGTLDIRELKRCIYNTVNIILQSNQYEDAVRYLDQFAGLNTYMNAK